MVSLSLGFLAVLGLLTTLGVFAPTAAYAGERQSPPESSPFSGTVGGERLGTTGTVVYPDRAAAAPPPDVNAEAYVVADLNSGAVYAARNAHRKLHPADTLKTLTALTLLPRLDERAIYTATAADANAPGTEVGLRPGQEYTIEQLFYGLLLASGNDAAHALAEANRGADATVEQMTEKARRLGAYDTTVATPSGRDVDGQLSSAYDLALIGRAAMRNEDFVRYVTTPTVDHPGAANGQNRPDRPGSKAATGSEGGRDGQAGSSGTDAAQLQNTNELLTEYAGAIGVKDGYGPRAGHTLIGAAERGNHRLLVVLLGSDENAAQHAAKLLDWGFRMRTDTAAAAGGASAGGGAAASVGRLVDPSDVVRAANGGDGRSRPSRAIDDGPDGPTFTRTDRAAVTQQETLASAALGMLNTQTVLLLGGWLVFIVLASVRIRSYVRAHHPRRPRRPRPPG